MLQQERIPLLAKEGWPRHQKIMMPKATKVGADGVVRPEMTTPKL